MRNLSIFCDGGARGNPGPAASAFVVFDSKDIIFKDAKYLGKATNNEAEYNSLLMALEWLVGNSGGEDKVSITLDSQLVYKQVIGEYKIKSDKLKPLIIKVKKLEKEVGSLVSYHWSPRSANTTADLLVNKKLDEKTF